MLYYFWNEIIIIKADFSNYIVFYVTAINTAVSLTTISLKTYKCRINKVMQEHVGLLGHVQAETAAIHVMRSLEGEPS